MPLKEFRYMQENDNSQVLPTSQLEKMVMPTHFVSCTKMICFPLNLIEISLKVKGQANSNGVNKNVTNLTGCNFRLN